MKKKSLMAAILFVLGCAIGGAASRMVEPARAHAETAPAGQTRWSYKCIRQFDVQAVESQANQLGRQGWEMEIEALRAAHARQRGDADALARARKVTTQDPAVRARIVDLLLAGDPVLRKCDELIAVCDEAIAAGQGLVCSSD